MADDDGDHLASRVLDLAGAGLSRVEIAAALGLSEGELTAQAAAQPGLGLALQRAAVLERAWWEGLPREALAAGQRFNLAGWLGVMRWRWGGDDAPPPRAPKSPQVWARYEIPDNGRPRRKVPPPFVPPGR